MIKPIILSGGCGSRLWPMSRELMPKQFQKIDSKNTLLQNTLLRIRELKNTKPPIIVCNEDHRFIVANQLKDIGNNIDTIFLEQVGRNTLPAITVAAMAAKPDDLLLVLPSDHQINNTAAFCRTIEKSVEYASDGSLICFGAVPDKPETGFGYIVFDEQSEDDLSMPSVKPIQQFTEKPNLLDAKDLISRGALWNSGMFLFRADAILKEVEKHQSTVYLYAYQAFCSATRNGCFETLQKGVMNECPSISIDYGVLEHTSAAVVSALLCDWSDVGTWDGVWKTLEKDRNGNSVRGDVHLKEVQNSCILSESRLVTAIGLDGHVVVETADAVLVAKRDQVQDIKEIVEELKAKKRAETVTHKKVIRPWGSFECLETTDTVQVKRLVVNPGARLSLQRHNYREENWVVVHGTAKVTNGIRTFELVASESTYIPSQTLHQLENPGDEPLEIIEVQTGTYFGEDDIERFEDDYGRETQVIERIGSLAN